MIRIFLFQGLSCKAAQCKLAVGLPAALLLSYKGQTVPLRLCGNTSNSLRMEKKACREQIKSGEIYVLFLPQLIRCATLRESTENAA